MWKHFLSLAPNRILEFKKMSCCCEFYTPDVKLICCIQKSFSGMTHAMWTWVCFSGIPPVWLKIWTFKLMLCVWPRNNCNGMQSVGLARKIIFYLVLSWSINVHTPGNNHLEFSSSLYEKGKNSSILKGNRIYYNRIIFPTINI